MTVHIIVVIVAGVCLLRELLLPTSRIPQLRRQTHGYWAKTLNPTTAAMLWGIDIGLVFTTWFTFSGVWFVVAVALFAGGSTQGAAILGAYWIGRSLSVWLAPLMALDAEHVPHTLSILGESRRSAQIIHSIALVFCAISILIPRSVGWL
jgi:hypothetical protein